MPASGPGLLTALALMGACAAVDDPPPWSGVALLAGNHVGAADRRDVASDEVLVEARGYWQPRAGIRVGLGLGADGRDYSIEGSPAATGRTMRSGWLRLPALVMFSPHWGISTLSSVGIRSDGAAPARDGRQYTVVAGPLYVRDPDLIINVAAVASSRLRRGATIFPLVSLYWRFADDWRLTVVDEVDNVSRLSYRLRDDLDLGLRVDVRYAEFALDASSPHAPAVLRDELAVIGGEVGWLPWVDSRGDSWFEARVFIGMSPARRIVLYDRDGDEVSSQPADPSLAFGCTVRGRF